MTGERQGLLAKLAEIGDEAEKDGDYPRRGAELLAGQALLAPTVPPEFGGLGMPYAELARWCHAGGAVLPGLVTRRARERALFESGALDGGAVDAPMAGEGADA